MIDRYIEEEKAKLNELVSIIRELERQLAELETQKDSVAQNITNIDSRIDELDEKSMSLTKFKERSFNFLEKYLLKRKEYKQYVQDEKMYFQTKMEIGDERKECREKMAKLEEEKDSYFTFILPQYVCGYMKPDDKGSRSIIINDHSKDEQYTYTYFDDSINSPELER